MATIIYGVSGEGSGHSSRARVVATHLLEQGHTVKILSYDKGLANLRDDFDVIEVVGLTIVSHNNKVSMVRTATTNLGRLSDIFGCFRALKRLFARVQPDLVITDFEPTSAYMAKKYKLPLISIDNQHRMRYVNCETPSGLEQEALVTRTIIKAMVPKPSAALVTSFHAGMPLNNRTFVFPPMIGASVRSLTPHDGGPVLVYATAHFDALWAILARIDQAFVIYGTTRAEQQGNLSFKAASHDGFLNDLAKANAVIATAGFTLISESLFLGKPYLAYPMIGQFEQQLNAHMLDTLGYGAQGTSPDEATITQFLSKLDDYKAALKHYPRNTDEGILRKLDELIDQREQLN